jgi:putative RNA 2'-phosphotransferase
VSLVRDSKLLSLVLRHAPEKAGLTLGDGGWVKVSDLLAGLSNMNRPITPHRLEKIVADNDKKRFTISEDGLRIRAAQGHSIKIKHDFKKVTPPVYLYHGTATRFVESIKKTGLKPMSRQHVHLSIDEETATKVGQRHGKPIILTVSSISMSENNHDFYLSDNGVWLTDYVPVEYISLKQEV